jgi:hypothetical protein
MPQAGINLHRSATCLYTSDSRTPHATITVTATTHICNRRNINWSRPKKVPHNAENTFLLFKEPRPFKYHAGISSETMGNHKRLIDTTFGPCNFSLGRTFKQCFSPNFPVSFSSWYLLLIIFLSQIHTYKFYSNPRLFNAKWIRIQIIYFLKNILDEQVSCTGTFLSLEYPESFVCVLIQNLKYYW